MTTRKRTTARHRPVCRHKHPRRIEDVPIMEIVETFLVALVLLLAVGWILIDSIHRGEAVRPEWTKPHHHAAVSCASEDGAGPVHPCTWDALAKGTMGPSTPRYTVYVDGSTGIYAMEWWGGRDND